MSFNNRPDRPLESSLYVRLVSESELRKDTVKNFYSTVKASSPSNVLGSYETQDPNGNPTSALLVHRINEENKHEYEIPLHRNLTSNEIYEVALNLDNVLNEGDFLFESSTIDEECCPDEDEEEYMDEDVFERIAETFTRQMHNKWLAEREVAGWHYGETRSDENKTHPLMKPWDLLTESQRAIDYSLPEFFIDLLYENGYSVVSRNELED